MWVSGTSLPVPLNFYPHQRQEYFLDPFSFQRHESFSHPGPDSHELWFETSPGATQIPKLQLSRHPCEKFQLLFWACGQIPIFHDLAPATLNICSFFGIVSTAKIAQILPISNHDFLVFPSCLLLQRKDSTLLCNFLLWHGFHVASPRPSHSPSRIYLDIIWVCTSS